MSHLSAIGFGVHTNDDFNHLIEQVLSVATEHSTHENLTYLRYTDPSGAEIWLYGDNNSNDIVGMVPCFLPSQTQNYGVSSIEPIIDDEQCGDGSAYGWLDPTEYSDGEFDGFYPLLVDLPDYLNHHASHKVQKARLTLFAESADLFTDEDAFSRSQENDELKYGSESFIPIGTFTDDENPNDKMSASALMGCKVIKSELRTNQLTQNQFYWCLVETYGSSYEVVYPIDMFDIMPQVGNIIFGEYWITGRFE